MKYGHQPAVSVFHLVQKLFCRQQFIKCVQWKLSAGFADSQVMVKITGEDISSAPRVCWVLQANSASVSSFSAEYSSTEEVVERPVTGSTCTEASMEIPREETNNSVWKL